MSVKLELSTKDTVNLMNFLKKYGQGDLKYEGILASIKYQNKENDVKLPLIYHTINSSDITYFEYDPELSYTTLCQDSTRKWMPNFKHKWHESKGRKKIASLNGMLFSYIDYQTRQKTNRAIVMGTCMKDMGIWINKPYINDTLVNMIYDKHKLIIQDGVREDEYPKAWFIISGYPCMKNGLPDCTKYFNIDDRLRITNRTIFGQKRNGNIVMITMKMASLYRCQDLCVALGVENAIVLDGGGSTRFNLFGKKMNTNGYRKIANVLNLYSYLGEDDVLYPGRRYIKF